MQLTLASTVRMAEDVLPGLERAVSLVVLFRDVCFPMEHLCTCLQEYKFVFQIRNKVQGRKPAMLWRGHQHMSMLY